SHHHCSPWRTSFRVRRSLAADCRGAATPRYFVQYRSIPFPRIRAPRIRRAILVLAREELSPRADCSCFPSPRQPVAAVRVAAWVVSAPPWRASTGDRSTPPRDEVKRWRRRRPRVSPSPPATRDG